MISLMMTMRMRMRRMTVTMIMTMKMMSRGSLTMVLMCGGKSMMAGRHALVAASPPAQHSSLK